MSVTHNFESVQLVLDDAMSATCAATKATTKHIWTCVSPFHGDNRHYYQRTV